MPKFLDCPKGGLVALPEALDSHDVWREVDGPGQWAQPWLPPPAATLLRLAGVVNPGRGVDSPIIILRDAEES